SSHGLAFEHSGRHTVTVSVVWNTQGIPYRVGGSTAVWVDHPLDEADNRVAELLLHHEVGMAVALGGVPQALEEGARRIGAVVDSPPTTRPLTISGACKYRGMASLDDTSPDQPSVCLNRCRRRRPVPELLSTLDPGG